MNLEVVPFIFCNTVTKQLRMQAKISTQRVLHPRKDTLEIAYTMQLIILSTL